jgi:hypothetical protein
VPTPYEKELKTMAKIPPQISEFYRQLESITTFDRWELMKQLKPLTEVFEHKWNTKLTAESICLRFTLQSGELKSDFSSIDEFGKEKWIPTFDDFTEEQINYLKKRANKSKNTYLIAHYYHILFYIEKNRNHGIKALMAYKSLLTRNEEGNDLQSIVSAVINLTEKIKFEKEKTKDELLGLLNNNQIEIYQKQQISKLLINSDLFKSQEFKFFPNLLITWINSSIEENYSLNKESLLLAVKVCINNGLDSAICYEKLAENELAVLEQHTNPLDFLRVQILGEIIEYYKKAKNEAKYKKYLKEYTLAKKDVMLHEIDISPDEKAQKILNEDINRRVKIILSWDIEKILYHYSNHSPLFPDIDEIVESSKKVYKESFLQYTSTSLFDINNNVKSLTDNENVDRNIHLNYQYSFGIGVLPEFIRVMQIGAYNRSISYYNIYDYLARTTWLGQNIKESQIRSGQSNSYTWLNLMAPALHSFLIQLESSFLINRRLTYTNWILPTDSLTLKFEGALREFIKITGGSTSVMKKNELQEMLLDDLLNSETAKVFFSKNDLALFKMIFTKNGDNIRHNVAHGFYHPQDYNIENCCKIFLCVLRLSNYRLVTSPET